MKKGERSSEGFFRNIGLAFRDRLLLNRSKKEQALFDFLIIFSFVSLVVNAVDAVTSGNRTLIIRAFTEYVVIFLLVLLLTVSDRVLVFKNASVIQFVFCALALAKNGFGFVGAKGWTLFLAVISFIAGVALYGTVAADQFNDSNVALKYWLVYCGAGYKLMYSVAYVIVRGAVEPLPLVSVLNLVFSSVASVALFLVLIYQFDGFSFLLYKLHELFAPEGESVPVNFSEKPRAKVKEEKIDYAQTEKTVSEPAAETKAAENEGGGAFELRRSEDGAEDILVDGSAMEAEDNTELSPTEIGYAKFAMEHGKPDVTPRIGGLSGDMFDIWLDGDIICFQNDLGQALNGRGVRVAAIPFGDVKSLGLSIYSNGEQCIVLKYLSEGKVISIGFKKEYFADFKRLILGYEG